MGIFKVYWLDGKIRKQNLKKTFLPFQKINNLVYTTEKQDPWNAVKNPSKPFL